MNERPALLKNLGRRQNSIAITLTGTRSNRSAIGARCSITSGERVQIADVVSGGSYYSQSSLTLYFGLGKAERVDRIEVRWPSGDKQVWTGIAPNRTVQLTEGRQQIVERPFSAARTPQKK